MVLVLPTIGDQLGSGLDKLIGGINHAINPDYGFQQAMKAQLATNPKLVQSLADLEVQAPGTLQRLGFGPLTSILKGVPESPEGTFQRTSKGDIVSGEQAKLAADTAGAKLNANLHAKVLAALSDPDNPQLAQDYIQRALSGENVAEYQTTVARGKEAAMSAQLKEVELPGLIAQAKAKQEQLDSFIKDFPQLKAANPVDLINDVLAGRKPAVDLAEYAMREGGSEALNTARIIADMKFRASEAKANRALTQKLDPTERANIQTAAYMAKHTRIGDVDTWRTVLENPSQVEELRKMKPSELNQDQKDILRADDAHTLDLQRQDAADQFKEQREQAQQIVSLRQAESTARTVIAKAGSQADIEAGLGPLNQLIGPNGYRAKYGLPPDVGQVDTQDRKRVGALNLTKDWFAPKNQLFYVDANNKRVPDNAPFVNKTYVNQQKAYSFIQQYRGDKDPKSKEANLKALQEQQPDVYKLVSPFIKE